MRVLTFMSLGEAKSEVKFDDMCKELNIGLDEIEDFVIEGTYILTLKSSIRAVVKPKPNQ